MPWPTNIFVAGTDTHVGKTVIAAALALGMRAHYWKPVQAGVEPTDSETVTQWLGNERIVPEAYRLTQALSPHLAARCDGVTISLSSIRPPQNVSLLVVEGAGGLLTPLNDQLFMIDLIVQLNLPVVLVARNQLGTINHSLLSIKLLRERGVEILGVILSGGTDTQNLVAIREFSGITQLCHVPWLEKITPNELRSIYTRFMEPVLKPKELLHDARHVG